jgi:hypothetical protein
MDGYEYIYDSISTYIVGYTIRMMLGNIDSISMIANTLGGIYFMASPIGYFLTIGTYWKRGNRIGILCSYKK